MAEAIFYVNVGDKLDFLCRLCEKIVTTTRDKIVILSGPSRALQEEISEALWTVIPNSFLAHEAANRDFEDIKSPIVITANDDWAFNQNVFPILINLPFFERQNDRVQKTIFLAAREEAELKKARRAYQSAKKTGMTVTHHDMLNFNHS